MAAQNHISKARAAHDGEQSELVFWSALWLNLATGVAGGLLIYLSSIRARPIVLDMVGHLAFLGVSAYLAHAVTNLAALAVVAACLACANVAWSMTTSPSLRGIARMLCCLSIQGEAHERSALARIVLHY